jgi:hypothetical protein
MIDIVWQLIAIRKPILQFIGMYGVQGLRLQQAHPTLFSGNQVIQASDDKPMLIALYGDLSQHPVAFQELIGVYGERRTAVDRRR